MKLFMFYVGGNFRNSNTELHDARFSVGEAVPDCYEDLRAQWWGDPKSLHLDCWGEVEQVDGFNVFIGDGPPQTTEHRLFFVNLGGYDPDQFAELHHNFLIVAPDEATAKTRALSKTAAGISHTKTGCSRLRICSRSENQFSAPVTS